MLKLNEGAKKKEGSNSKAVKFVTQLYPHMKQDEVELLASINTTKELKELAKQMGWTDPDIKKALG